ncbi:hypothetical protein A4S06_02710 [Erysipelotrichaceae bacterium MTC7]|nr:hypothetical protein A4S06_02710 [Erysipelotrichaceae bacterium MTC7]
MKKIRNLLIVIIAFVICLNLFPQNGILTKLYRENPVSGDDVSGMEGYTFLTEDFSYLDGKLTYGKDKPRYDYQYLFKYYNAVTWENTDVGKTEGSVLVGGHFKPEYNSYGNLSLGRASYIKGRIELGQLGGTEPTRQYFGMDNVFSIGAGYTTINNGVAGIAGDRGIYHSNDFFDFSTISSQNGQIQQDSQAMIEDESTILHVNDIVPSSDGINCVYILDGHSYTIGDDLYKKMLEGGTYDSPQTNQAKSVNFVYVTESESMSSDKETVINFPKSLLEEDSGKMLLPNAKALIVESLESISNTYFANVNFGSLQTQAQWAAKSERLREGTKFIWNIPFATELRMHEEAFGLVLAPNANIDASKDAYRLYGQVIAKSINSTSLEIYSVPYGGTDEPLDPYEPPVQTYNYTINKIWKDGETVLSKESLNDLHATFMLCDKDGNRAKDENGKTYDPVKLTKDTGFENVVAFKGIHRDDYRVVETETVDGWMKDENPVVENGISTFINTKMVKKTFDYTVNKVWKDGETVLSKESLNDLHATFMLCDKDGNRAKDENGKTYDPVKLTKDTGFENVVAFKGIHRDDYKVVETSTVDGWSKDENPVVENGTFTFINRKKQTITVETQWNFQNDQIIKAGLSPHSILKLSGGQEVSVYLSDGRVIVPETTQTLKEENKWTHTYENLDYGLYTPVIEGYSDGWTWNSTEEVSDNHWIITFNQVPTYDYTITKKWSENGENLKNDQLSGHTASFEIKDGEDVVAEVKLDGTEETPWTTTITGLDKADYTIEEVGYTAPEGEEWTKADPEVNAENRIFAFTNTKELKQTIRAQKQWAHKTNHDFDENEAFVMFQLYKIVEDSEVAVGQPKRVDKSTNWKAVWEEMPIEETYKVEEVVGYENYVHTSTLYNEELDTWVITNKFKGKDPMIDMGVLKIHKQWNHGSNPKLLQPKTAYFDIYLNDDSEPFETVELTEVMNWEYSQDYPQIIGMNGFIDIPVLAPTEGTTNTYRVVERDIDNYETILQTEDGWEYHSTSIYVEPATNVEKPKDNEYTSDEDVIVPAIGIDKDDEDNTSASPDTRDTSNAMGSARMLILSGFSFIVLLLKRRKQSYKEKS